MKLLAISLSSCCSQHNSRNVETESVQVIAGGLRRSIVVVVVVEVAVVVVVVAVLETCWR